MAAGRFKPSRDLNKQSAEGAELFLDCCSVTHRNGVHCAEEELADAGVVGCPIWGIMGDPKIGPMKLRPIASVAQRVIWEGKVEAREQQLGLGEEGPKSDLAHPAVPLAG